MPFGALDIPGDNATIRGTSSVSGWALSEDGVDHVEIYLDRVFLQNAVMAGKREDVNRVYPAFAAVKDVRFFTDLHTEGMPTGTHELSARVISRKKLSRDLTSHQIIIAR